MKKIEIFYFIVVTVFIILFVILFFKSKQKSEIQVNIYPLENKFSSLSQNDSVLARKLTDFILTNYKPTKIEINFFLPNNKPKLRIQLKKRNEKEKQIWQNEIYKNIINGFKKLPIFSFSNDSINKVIINYCKFIEENSQKKQTVNIMVGTLPDCYNETSRDELLNKLANQFKEKMVKEKNLIFFILNPRENLEKKVFNTIFQFSPKNFNLKEIKVDLQREDCNESYPKIFGMFLKKFNSNEMIEFIQFLRKTFGEKFNLFIIHDGKLNGHSITYKNTPLDSIKLIETLNQFKDATWQSILFAFKELYNHTSNLPETTPKTALIIGHLKYNKEGKFGFEEGFWEEFSKVKGLIIYPIFPNYPKRNWRDKEIFDALQSKYNFNIVKQ